MEIANSTTANFFIMTNPQKAAAKSGSATVIMLNGHGKTITGGLDRLSRFGQDRAV
jgi:hypothetical protein